MPKTPDVRTLTRREREIMDILHRRGRATAQEVLAELADPAPDRGRAQADPLGERLLGQARVLLEFAQEGARGPVERSVAHFSPIGKRIVRF